MGLVIKGNVTGRMLAGAMIKAHMAMQGGLKEKQAAGVGQFRQYLGENAARQEAWDRLSRLSPEVFLARASLNSSWLKNAGRVLAQTTDIKTRRALLGQVIAPHLEASLTMFGVLAEGLQIELPEIELELLDVLEGSFMMGSKERRDERPVRRVTISGFRSGKYEVTNGQYGRFMEQTGHGEPTYWGDSKLGRGNPTHSVVGVDHTNDALGFADWVGMRLLTEAEGEYAARGPENLIYPWGNEWDASRVTFNTNGTRPVNAHPEGASPFGVMDLSGNVWEWRADWHVGRYYPEDLVNPKGPEKGAYKVLRGGSWFDIDPDSLRSAFRNGNHPENRDDGDVGFRVAEDK